MPEFDQVADRLGDTVVIGRTDDVDRAGRDRPTHDDHRHLAVQPVQRLLGTFGPEEHQRFTARIEKSLDRAGLVGRAVDRAQDDVVAVTVGRVVQVQDQRAVERAGDVHQHSDGPAAPAGQRAGQPVRAVAEPVGSFQNAFPGLGTGSGHPPEHQGNGRRRNPERLRRHPRVAGVVPPRTWSRGPPLPRVAHEADSSVDRSLKRLKDDRQVPGPADTRRRPQSAPQWPSERDSCQNVLTKFSIRSRLVKLQALERPGADRLRRQSLPRSQRGSSMSALSGRLARRNA